MLTTRHHTPMTLPAAPSAACATFAWAPVVGVRETNDALTLAERRAT